ncbi:MAG: hypothetical protein GY769_10455 [bacterium]|nr:hypothetical protein [bacterium]
MTTETQNRTQRRLLARPGYRLARQALAAGFVLQMAMLGMPTSATPEAERVAAWEWKGVSRVVAVGDLHGNHDKLIRLLTAAELIDRNLRWSGGASHLVVAGDFLDRGDDDRPLMDVLRRLEQESVAGGGRVHVLLGNHEVMNLFRDTRYVSPAAYRHFAPKERKAVRKAALGKFAALKGGDWSSDTFREFNQKYPPGFFARQEALNPDGEYGSWLLLRPAIVKINEVAYLHGGLSEDFAALGIDDINRRMTDQVRRHLEARQALEREGAISGVMDFLQLGEAAAELLETRRGGRTAKLRETARSLLLAANNPILGAQGPLWYRGNALQDERLEQDTIERSLELLGASAMVVAHSPTSTSRITSRFHGRLFRIDHNIDGSEAPLALVAEQGEILVLNSSNGERTKPFRELPLGQLLSSRTAALPDHELDRFLSDSPVIASRNLGRGSTRPRLMVLESEGEIRRGIFKTVQSDVEGDRYQHEVAAYRLDRAIGLGMVPVAVVRTLEGQAGSLQAWVEGAIDREAVQAYELEFCKTPLSSAQLARSRLFDALIGNAGRKQADILCLVKDQKIMLIDHSRAFTTSTDLPPEVGQSLSTPAQLTAALKALSREALDLHVGELISDRQIEALLERRDKIVDHLEVAVASSP